MEEKRMMASICHSVREVTEYANDHQLLKDDIVTVFTNNRGEYIIIYYG